jgi:hypothetical protein
VVVALVLLVTGPLSVGSTLGGTGECDRVDVSVDGDTCGSMLSVSATGDANGTDCWSANASTCVAVSGAGEASNRAGDEACVVFTAIGCVAVSGTGNASNTAGEPSCATGCLAVDQGTLAGAALPE